MSHIQSIRERNTLLQEEIIYMLGLTEPDWLFWLRVEAGLSFIDQVLKPKNEEVRQLFVSSRIFWGWWVNEWVKRDSELISNTRYERGDIMYQTPLLSGEPSQSCRIAREKFHIFYRKIHGVKIPDLNLDSAVLERICTRKTIA